MRCKACNEVLDLDLDEELCSQCLQTIEEALPFQTTDIYNDGEDG